jgi:hypothetical protein
LIKGILGIILATISPFIVLTIIGTLYALLNMFGGATFTAGVRSFINFIISLKPYLPYLTAIPVILVLLILFIKRRRNDTA